MKKLYTTIPRERKIMTFLYKFLSYIQKHDACYAAATYYDKECTKLHCAEKKWRGFDDILALTKTYYPSITTKKLMIILIKMPIPEGYKGKDFDICYGTGILRYMFYIAKLTTKFNNGTIPDNSKYSWYQLFKLVGVTNQKSYDKIANSK